MEKFDINAVGAFNSFELISNKTCYKACGYSDDDLSRPIIGIANSYNEMVSGHINLRELAEQVKYGVYRAGGTPVEFGVIACCDGITDNHDGAHYVLPSRENIADAVEIQARAHKLDGLVLLASCDKIIPGMLMAAARLDIPTVFLPGGCTLSAPPFGKKLRSDTTSISEGLGKYTKGEISYEELQDLTQVCAPSCGSCQFMGTANTMSVLGEALGLGLCGSGLIPAGLQRTPPLRLQERRKGRGAGAKAHHCAEDNDLGGHRERNNGPDGRWRFDECGHPHMCNSL